MAAGEYTLFGVNTPDGTEVFHLQGRLGPRGWPATTTVALAFGVPGVYGYQVSVPGIQFISLGRGGVGGGGSPNFCDLN